LKGIPAKPVLTGAGMQANMFLMTTAATNGADEKKAAAILRFIARFIGVIVLVFFLSMLIGDFVQSIHDQGFNSISAESLFILLPVILALIAFIISWWQEFIGGMSLVLAYLLLSFSPSVHSIYYETEAHFYIGMFFFALPFLIAGLLFMVASRLSKRV
jgi:hypothetical protein